MLEEDKPIQVSTYLGFDVGGRYVGVAVGQDYTRTANPLAVLMVSEKGMDWDGCMKLIQKYRPRALVVGVPYNTGYGRQYTVQMAEDFAKMIGELSGLPVFLTDEHLSTQAAKELNSNRSRSRRATRVDAIAAQVILEQWFLERHRDESK